MRYVEKYSRAGQALDNDMGPVQPGPGVHPASYTMCTGSYPGVKRPGRGVEHLPPSSLEVYTYSPSEPP